MAEENFKKMVKDGKVAVLVSHGFGAGWYTWNTEHPGMAFDADIVQAVLDKDEAKAVSIAEEKYPGIYSGGSDGLSVHWVEQGKPFEITEYDGSENLRMIEIYDFMVA